MNVAQAGRQPSCPIRLHLTWSCVLCEDTPPGSPILTHFFFRRRDKGSCNLIVEARIPSRSWARDPRWGLAKAAREHVQRSQFHFISHFKSSDGQNSESPEGNNDGGRGFTLARFDQDPPHHVPQEGCPSSQGGRQICLLGAAPQRWQPRHYVLQRERGGGERMGGYRPSQSLRFR